MRQSTAVIGTRKLGPVLQSHESDVRKISQTRPARTAAISEHRSRFSPTKGCEVPESADDTSSIKYVLNASGSVTRINKRGTAYTGRSLEQLRGSAWQSCIHPEDLELLCGSRAGAIGRKEPFTATYRMRTAAGVWRWVHDRGTPVQYGGELVWFGILDDVDDTVSEQLRMLEANRGLERSNRDLRHFASVVAHDLQSPLGTIGTMSTWLAEEYGDRLDANANEYLSYMGKAVQRMNDLVKATLLYSRVEADCRPAPEIVDAGEVLEWTLVTLSGEIKQSQASVTFGPLPKLDCSEHALVQLFQNLISNAIRYGAPGSSPRIHVSATCSATEWTFSVADNGIGIAPADTDRIFELFQRVNADGRGLGIGLSICRKVVEHLGGRIWVESERGKGSIFYFTIPR